MPAYEGEEGPMSETASPDGDPFDHRSVTDWVAQSSSHGKNRRLHRVAGDPDADALESGDEVDTPCETTLTSPGTYWRAAPAVAFPPGYAPLCSDCFGLE